MCCPDKHHTNGDAIALDVAATFLAGLGVLAKAGWWVARHLLAPAITVLAVAVWRWTLALPLLPDRTTGTPLVSRGVRATAHNLLTLTALGILVDPVATVITATSVTALATGTVAGLRWRVVRRGRPRRVRVRVGAVVPTAPSPSAGARPAITGHSTDTTWTGQTITDQAAAA